MGLVGGLRHPRRSNAMEATSKPLSKMSPSGECDRYDVSAINMPLFPHFCPQWVLFVLLVFLFILLLGTQPWRKEVPVHCTPETPPLPLLLLFLKSVERIQQIRHTSITCCPLRFHYDKVRPPVSISNNASARTQRPRAADRHPPGETAADLIFQFISKAKLRPGRPAVGGRPREDHVTPTDARNSLCLSPRPRDVTTPSPAGACARWLPVYRRAAVAGSVGVCRAGWSCVWMRRCVAVLFQVAVDVQRPFIESHFCPSCDCSARLMSWLTYWRTPPTFALLSSFVDPPRRGTVACLRGDASLFDLLNAIDVVGPSESTVSS